MKRHNKEFSGNFDDKRGYGRQGGADRGGRNFADRDAPRSNFSGRARYGSDDRPRPSTFRHRDGDQGGYGRQQRPFGEGRSFDRPQREQGDRPRFGRPKFDRPGHFEGPSRPDSRPPRPNFPARVVPANKLKSGIAEANRALAGIVEQFGESIEGDYDIGSLEVTVSFNEEGKFIGFGRGGVASMTLSLSPLDAEQIVEQLDDEAAELLGDDDAELEHAEDLIELESAGADEANLGISKAAASDAHQAPQDETAHSFDA